jgi:ribonuclease VapC
VSNHVLDASALLALLNGEQGADYVQKLLSESSISSVNLAEVITRLSAAGMPEGEIREVISLLGLEILPFDSQQAFQAGLLLPYTRSLGLSLGDRACLALAQVTGSTALTADQAWIDVEIGIEIKLIR